MDRHGRRVRVFWWRAVGLLLVAVLLAHDALMAAEGHSAPQLHRHHDAPAEHHAGPTDHPTGCSVGWAAVPRRDADPEPIGPALRSCPLVLVPAWPGRANSTVCWRAPCRPAETLRAFAQVWRL